MESFSVAAMGSRFAGQACGLPNRNSAPTLNR
jgi:hypothetical protein